MTTLKEIDKLDESKFNTILRPKAKSRPPKDCDLLGFDMEWQTDGHGNDNVLSCQLAWYDDSGNLKSRVFQFGVDADRLLRLVEGCLGRPTRQLVILVSHFAVPEIGHITNSLKEFSIRQFNHALKAQKQFDFEDSEDSYERTGGGFTQNVMCTQGESHGKFQNVESLETSLRATTTGKSAMTTANRLTALSSPDRYPIASGSRAQYI